MPRSDGQRGEDLRSIGFQLGDTLGHAGLDRAQRGARAHAPVDVVGPDDEGHPLDGGRDDQQVRLQVAGEEARGQVLVDHRLDTAERPVRRRNDRDAAATGAEVEHAQAGERHEEALGRAPTPPARVPPAPTASKPRSAKSAPRCMPTARSACATSPPTATATPSPQAPATG